MSEPKPDSSSSASRWLMICALLGALGVAAGAFGAHGLRSRVSAEQLEWWQTAARYQQIHAVALLVVAWSPDRWTRARHVAAFGFSLGMVVFSGTLYAMALGGPRILGAITPLGGLGLILAWVALAVHAKQRR